MFINLTYSKDSIYSIWHLLQYKNKNIILEEHKVFFYPVPNLGYIKTFNRWCNNNTFTNWESLKKAEFDIIQSLTSFVTFLCSWQRIYSAQCMLE